MFILFVVGFRASDKVARLLQERSDQEVDVLSHLGRLMLETPKYKPATAISSNDSETLIAINSNEKPRAFDDNEKTAALSVNDLVADNNDDAEGKKSLVVDKSNGNPLSSFNRSTSTSNGDEEKHPFVFSGCLLVKDDNRSLNLKGTLSFDDFHLRLLLLLRRNR